MLTEASQDAANESILQTEPKPLPAIIPLGRAQQVSLTALKNEETACLQQIGNKQAEIKQFEAMLEEIRNARAEILSDVAVAFSIPAEAMNGYMNTGKQLVKA